MAIPGFALTHAKGSSAYLFRQTILDKLLNKIDCSGALKDGKIEDVHVIVCHFAR